MKVSGAQASFSARTPAPALALTLTLVLTPSPNPYAQVSFSLMQDGKELEVKGLNNNPIQLTVPVADASDTKSKCTGQPDARNQMTALFGGEPACAETLECRYWDEENTIWSTEGCETRLYNGTDGGSFTGCECSHPNPSPNPSPNPDPNLTR